MPASLARRLSWIVPLAIAVAGCASLRGGAAEGTGTLDAFVVAHPDDWQLFMGDVAVRAIRAGHRTVFLYTTAGDAGEPPRYWQARQRGTLASVAFALGEAPPDTDAAIGAGPQCADTTIAGHTVERCVWGVTVSYYLHLPDGNVGGDGFELTGMRSLAQLAAGKVVLAPLSGTGAYLRWDDLVDVVTAVLRREASLAGAAGDRVRVHASDPDTLFNPRDHSDHRATGRLAASIAQARGWSLVQYAGYSIARWPRNLDAARFADKAGLFMSYDRARIVAYGKWSAYAEDPPSYSAWLSRTYVRPAVVTQPMP